MLIDNKIDNNKIGDKVKRLGKCDICGKWFVPEVIRDIPIYNPNIRIAKKDADRLNVCLTCLLERATASKDLGWKHE